MPISSVRGIAKGVNTDVDPYNLPIGMWSFGNNVRFKNGSILRAPVFRNVVGLSNPSPRYVTANTPNNGFSSIIVGYLNGTVSSIVNGAETDISISGYTPVDEDSCFTSCQLGDVLYVNRNDRIPWSLRTSDTIFQPLANWDATWRANIIRAAGGALCAFGITKGGVSYPTMVKTSEFAVADTVPASWDETDPTTNATENILAEMRSPITDANPLGENVMVYGIEETWVMTADGSQEVWSYHRLFDNLGAINANCSVEADKKHYVFGLNDIWMHDGISPVSIADQRVKDFIFSSIDMGKAKRCFVSYNPKLKEVYFNFASGDSYASFTNVDGCNRCAVYSIPEDSWTFYDLPYIFGSIEANVDSIQTWSTINATWATIGGTWLDQEASLKRVMVMIGDVNTTYGLSRSLYAFDLQGVGSVVSLPVDTNATKGWALYRDGLDLDEIGADLKGYKLLSSLYPQARLEADASPIVFTVGSADYFNTPAPATISQTYDGQALYRLDFNVSGRYLNMVVSQDDYRYFNMTALDFDLDILGER